MAVAWMLIGPAPAPAPAPIIQQQAAPQARTTEVLVAARELPIGTLLAQADVRWVAWPTDSIPSEMIRAGGGVTIEKDIVGSLVRSSFVNGEPLRAEKLIRPDGSGYLSAILPSGKRAVAIVIDRTGSSTAGGFVLPNDRVDVIKISRQDGQRESYISETILHNIRVLAIGTKLEERGPDKVVTAETATLELDARQVETVALAQRSGTITLALRSLADANEERPPSAEQPSLTVVRFGVSTQSPR